LKRIPQEENMAELLARNWWVVALRGVIAVLFGLMALLWPGITLVALVYLFGAYVFVDGICTLATALQSHAERPRWWALLLEGLAGIAAGVIAFVWPGITALTLLYLIAVWAIATGVFEIIAAIRLREEIEGEWFLGLSGLASALFGVLVVIWPGAGALSVIWLIGAYAIVFGGLLVVLAFRLHAMLPSAHRPAAS
jgi:uncharacterized membrane protein HdeD (DUF308 family)